MCSPNYPYKTSQSIYGGWVGDYFGSTSVYQGFAANSTACFQQIGFVVEFGEERRFLWYDD
jgi:hypothetical protein